MSRLPWTTGDLQFYIAPNASVQKWDPTMESGGPHVVVFATITPTPHPAPQGSCLQGQESLLAVDQVRQLNHLQQPLKSRIWERAGT